MKGRFAAVAKVSEVEKKGLLGAKMEEVELLLIGTQGKVYALENSCSHQGLSMEEGTVRGCILTCPHHSVSYDVESGAVCDDRGFLELPPLRTFSVRVEGDCVMVELPE